MRLALAVVALVAALPAACTSKSDETPTKSPDPPHLNWQQVSVPVPPGDPGRIVVRAATACDGKWYLGGGVATPTGDTRPGMWTSTDARTWAPLPLAPITFYGKQNIFYALACKNGGLAAVGARFGGVHGNPRVSTWRLGADGTLSEIPAAFTLYGGGDAVNVARMGAGPTGFMITGNRVTGAAVWTSADGAAFEIHENVKPLASDPGLDGAASDVAGTAGGWVVVGGGTQAGRGDRDPVVWTSADGAAWTRTVLPGSNDYEELQRVVVSGEDVVAVGLRGGTFGAWRRPAGGEVWEALGAFGNTRPPTPPGGGAARPAVVLSLAAADKAGNGVLLATVSDGQQYQLWASRDLGRTWTRAPQPAEQAAAADSAAAVAWADGRWLYLSDDAAAGRVWAADSSG